MHARKQGAGSPPVVLVHGLGAHSYSWEGTVAAIGSSHSTYAVDLLGFGQSAAPADFPCTMAAQAEAVAAFLAAEGVTDPVLIGHSMGGGVCLRLATRTDLRPSKLILLAPLAYPPPARFFGLDPLAQAALQAAPVFEPALQGQILVRRILEQAYADPSKVTDQQVAGYAAGMRTQAQLAAFYGHLPYLGEVAVPEEEFGQVRAETLVIWGSVDPFLPVSQGITLVGRLPGARLEQIAGCGHIPHEEFPTETHQLIRAFLR
jgi:pimeloyl-ACP methyl ester carboxylesterase